MQTKHHSNGALIIIPIFLAIGVIAYGLTLPSNACMLYFPDQHAKNLVLEKRALNPIGSTEERAIRVLDELALGPMNHNLQPLLPSGAEIVSVMLRSGTLYVNIEILDLSDSMFRYSLLQDSLEKSVKSSVPGIRHIRLFLNGVEASR